jgi:outer membrane protein
MGMPIDQLIYLEEDLEDVRIEFDDEILNEFEYSDRIEYSQLETSKTLAELDLKNNQVQYFPRLSAFVNLGANMGTNRSTEIFDFSNHWFESGAFGATLTLPIFDGLRKSYKIQQSRLTIAQLDNSFNTLRNAIDLSIVQSRINLNNSLETLDSYKENMELAKEVSDVAKIKYQEGVGSNIEVVDAEIAYQQAESNYFNALYDALVAKTDLQTALGTLIK